MLKLDEKWITVAQATADDLAYAVGSLIPLYKKRVSGGEVSFENTNEDREWWCPTYVRRSFSGCVLEVARESEEMYMEDQYAKETERQIAMLITALTDHAPVMITQVQLHYVVQCGSVQALGLTKGIALCKAFLAIAGVNLIESVS